MNRRSSTRRGAFTLIELLVVVAIIAMLLSILLPSLSGAREHARAVVCGQKLRDLGTGLATYFAENSDWIPGVNTSGIAVRRVDSVSGALDNARLPVQSFDWITPVLSRSIEMQAGWGNRWQELLNKFHCPSQQLYRSVVWPGANIVPEWDGYMRNEATWTSVSYLMPAHFQLWGRDYAEGQPGAVSFGVHAVNPTLQLWAMAPDPGWEIIHQTYRSRVSEVGSPAGKIAAADGFRYLAEDDTLDFDPSPAPRYFGSFTSSGAYWCGSTEYGVRPGTKNWSNRPVTAGNDPPGRGKNLALSYRHGVRGGISGTAQDNRGTVNALFFDGSVRRLTDRASRTPNLWYPKGAKVYKYQQGMIDDLRNNDLVP